MTAGAAYRLPTEAEWEQAAYGSQAGCGDRDWDEGTCPVGTYGSNAAGLSDMVGNLWELTSDCSQGNCGFRVLRGGSWSYTAEDLPLGARSWSAAGERLEVRRRRRRRRAFCRLRAREHPGDEVQVVERPAIGGRGLPPAPVPIDVLVQRERVRYFGDQVVAFAVIHPACLGFPRSAPATASPPGL